jgi:hypothetical protein
LKIEPQTIVSHVGPDPFAECVSLVERLEAIVKNLDDLTASAQRERESYFFRKCICQDLDSLSIPGDSPQIAHFSVNDFLIVLERCARAKIQVFGVEAFAADGHFLGVSIPVNEGDLTHAAFVKNLSGQAGVSVCASYGFEGVSLTANEESVPSARARLPRGNGDLNIAALSCQGPAARCQRKEALCPGRGTLHQQAV